MTQARQWWVLVRYKDEPGAGFGKQYVTATNAYEAIQMANDLPLLGGPKSMLFWPRKLSPKPEPLHCLR